jgi:hypothetical protein
MKRSPLCGTCHPGAASTPGIHRHPLLRRLITMGLQTGDFVVFGSAPLLVHGIRADVRDIDIVARGAAWQQARATGVAAVGPITGSPMAYFWGGRIEVSPQWTSPNWDVDLLIHNADAVQGVRFARLQDVLAHKRALGRKKDEADIAAIELHLLGPHKPFIGYNRVRGAE